jgi:hypothetical protein
VDIAKVYHLYLLEQKVKPHQGLLESQLEWLRGVALEFGGGRD